MTPLIQQLEALVSEIAALKASGEIAAANTWIAQFVVTKPNGKRYVYYRLMQADTKRSPSGKIQGKFLCYLGKASSSKYTRCVEAIKRRNQLQRLEREQARLEAKLAQQRVVASPSVSSGQFQQPELTFNLQAIALQLSDLSQQFHNLLQILSQHGILVFAPS